MRLACPQCSAEISVNKRRVRRARPTAVRCDPCGAQLAVSRDKSGGLQVALEGPGSAQPKAPETPEKSASATENSVAPEALEVAVTTANEALSELPETAFHRSDSGGIPPTIPPGSPFATTDEDPGFSDAMRDKTDPDAASAFDQTDPGSPIPTDPDAAAPTDTVPDDSVAPVVVMAPGATRASGPVRAHRPSGTRRRPTRKNRKSDTSPTTVDARRAQQAAEAPLTMAMPDPARRVRQPRDVDKMLREYSVMFRLDDKSKRRRSTLLTLGVLVVGAGAVVAVALSSQGPDIGVLQAMQEAAEDMDPARSSRIEYVPSGERKQPAGMQRTRRVSALAGRLAQVIAEKIAAQRAQAEAAAAPPPTPPPPDPPVVKPTEADKPVKRKKRRRKRRKKRRTRTLPSFE